jgi:hypothetical protein
MFVALLGWTVSGMAAVAVILKILFWESLWWV